MPEISDLQKSEPTNQQLKAMPAKMQVKHLLAKNKKEIAAALPKMLTYERLTQVALMAVTQTPGLQECHVPSLFSCIIKAASLGLEPNSALGHAYLLPFRNNKANRTDCQLIVGYKGLLHLARRSGEIISISAHEVHENDLYEFEYGLNEKLRHVPCLGDRGTLTHFYAVALLKGGGHVMEVMTKADVDKIRAGSKGGKYGPWNDHYVAMGRKTAIRKLMNYLPLSVEQAEAAIIAGKNEAQQPTDFGNVFDGEFGQVSHHEEFASEDASPESKANADNSPFGITPDGDPLDINGEIFDAKIHSASKGRPVFTEDGSFQSKRKSASKRAGETIDME